MTFIFRENIGKTFSAFACIYLLVSFLKHFYISLIIRFMYEGWTHTEATSYKLSESLIQTACRKRQVVFYCCFGWISGYFERIL